MPYYLRWSSSSGDSALNNETLEISGIVGTLASVEYTVQSAATAYSENRYVFDIRRLQGGLTSGSDVGYILQFSSTKSNIDGISSPKKNGSTIREEDFFSDFVAGDVFSFVVNAAPSGGAIAFGARHNEVEHFADFAVSSIVITDSDGAHTIDFTSTGGTGSSATSGDGALTATLFNFPTDNSQWVQFGPPTVAPTEVSASIAGNEATVTWVEESTATAYLVEFRSMRP
jgi:hypothetical protein